MRIPPTTLVVEHPSVDAIHARRHYPEATDLTGIAFVTCKLEAQLAHEHHFTLTVDTGYATCQCCGAYAWSMSWVGANLFGEQTEQWIIDHLRVQRDLVEMSLAPVVKVVAMLGEDMPAKPGRHRRGVPVPTMGYGVTGVRS